MSNIDKRALREAAEKANPEKYGFYLVDAFEDLATPETVLALLDELEAKDRRIEEEIGRANREHHRGFMMACGHLKEYSNVHYADAAEMEIAALRNRINELESAPPAPVSVPDVLKRLRSLVADQRALPRRKEWISGQQYSYVLLENVEAMVDEACRAAMLQGAEPVTTANKLRDAVETIRNSGIEIDAEKIFAERDAINAPDCWCRTCRPITLTDMRFVVCPECGNKRCPHANDHRHACTGSNEPG